ncbi:hypothetical protein Tco_0945749 [Tanacetum coccineum]
MLTSLSNFKTFYSLQQLAVLKRDISYKDSEISVLKSELEKLNKKKKAFNLRLKNLIMLLRPEFGGYGPKTSKSVSEYTSNEVRESPDASLVKVLVSNDKLEKKTVFPIVAKINFVRPQQQEKPVRKPIKYAEMYSFNHVHANCNYHQRERMVSGNNYTRVNYNYSAKKAHLSAHRNIVPRVFLMKTGLRPLNTARPVNTAHPKTTVYSARPMYALTKNPTIYVSLIEKFWQTVTVRIVDNVEQEITATVDGKEFTITEASIRRHLQLADVDGISVFPTNEIFDQLSLMGYVLTDDKMSFQKGKFSP